MGGAEESTQAIMQRLKDNLQVSGADLVKRIKGVVVFNINDKLWTLDLTSGAGSLTEGEPPGDAKPDLTLTIDDNNFASLVSGKLGAQQAFLFRKLKIKGSMAMAMKLQPILDAANAKPSKL